MNRKPLVEPMSITQAFTAMQVKSDAQKIRHNSHDDHGLKAQGYRYLMADNDVVHPEDGWISQPGKPRTIGDWHCRYAKPCQEIVDACLPFCLEGAIGSFDIKRWRDPERIVLLFTDSTMIATYFVCVLTAETLFQKIVLAGVEFDHHESDLYLRDCPEAREILEEFPLNKSNATTFRSEIEPRDMWLDVPFAYEYWWIKRRVQ
jgi:hypothetical protein